MLLRCKEQATTTTADRLRNMSHAQHYHCHLPSLGSWRWQTTVNKGERGGDNKQQRFLTQTNVAEATIITRNSHPDFIFQSQMGSILWKRNEYNSFPNPRTRCQIVWSNMVVFVTDCCLAGTCHMVYAFLYFFNRFIGNFQIVTSKIFAFFFVKDMRAKEEDCCILVSHCYLSSGHLASLIGSKSRTWHR